MLFAENKMYIVILDLSCMLSLLTLDSSMVASSGGGEESEEGTLFRARLNILRVMSSNISYLLLIIIEEDGEGGWGGGRPRG